MNMLSDITIILLIIHFLGDFQLQSQEISDMKLKSKKHLTKHILTHAALLIVPVILFIKYNTVLIGLLTILSIVVSHYLIDILKSKIAIKNSRQELKLFLVDQFLHIFVILLFTEILFKKQFFVISKLIIDRTILNWILILVLVTKPANILFKIGFKKYNIKSVDTETEIGAGALIGSLERILSIIFLSMGQVSAIGLIYTAKSIARFKEIEENKRFAEYYLIGTLYSILYAIIVFYLMII
ncbi:DUF3307 domain-containing protein [Helcococcus kunzii]|uniref:DUF3307 domain-containing protein n=1 Tax=Helcococcus kunzii TaxID=40091 RepID=UPI0024AE77AF|nr:DUF3307 domain-containing protein [Helcococcus kunzii]